MRDWGGFVEGAGVEKVRGNGERENEPLTEEEKEIELVAEEREKELLMEEEKEKELLREEEEREEEEREEEERKGRYSCCPVAKQRRRTMFSTI